MPAVKFGFDVRRHLDSVDHQVAHQPVDDGILHDHSDQTGASQVAFSEFGTGQVLVLECRHTGQYPSAYRHCVPWQIPLGRIAVYAGQRLWRARTWPGTEADT